MKTGVIPYEDQSTTMRISIDTIHTKSFHIKLTVAKGSIYFRLCYEEYVKPSRHEPASNFKEFKASNTICVNVPNLGISSMFVSRSSFISTELPLVSKLLTSANSSCFSWSKQSRYVQVQVLVVNCGHPRKSTADKTPSCPLRESVNIRPLPLNKIGETR